MGFTSSSLSSLASPFGAEDAIDGMSGLDALDGMDPIEEIDFYKNDDDDNTEMDFPTNKQQQPSKKAIEFESVDEQRPRNHHTTSASIDLGIYIISGLFLILLMEQFIQLGTRLRM